MMDRGYKTQRQAFEESLWDRMAYHGSPANSGTRGHVSAGHRDVHRHLLRDVYLRFRALSLRLAVRRENVRRLLTAMREMLPNQHHMEIHPIPLKSIFKVDRNTDLDLEDPPLDPAHPAGRRGPIF